MFLKIYVFCRGRANKTKIFKKNFCLLLFEGTFQPFFKEKSHKEVTNSSNQGFSYYFFA
jgi:hypothetical protein